MNPVLTKYFGLLQERKAIIEDPALPPDDKFRSYLEVGTRMQEISSNMDEETLSSGRLLWAADLANKGADYTIVDEQNPLFKTIEDFNRRTNEITGLSLPLPQVWVVNGLAEKQGFPASYVEFGDVIMLDDRVTREQMDVMLAAEFGSRSTNKLYPEEIDSSNRYNTAVDLADSGATITELMRDNFMSGASIQRECEMSESVIAAKLVGGEKYIRVNAEIYAQHPEFGFSPDEEISAETQAMMDHPIPSVTNDVLSGMIKDGSLDDKKMPNTSFSCHSPAPL